jgi:DNA-binding response OmpR family regulator
MKFSPPDRNLRSTDFLQTRYTLLTEHQFDRPRISLSADYLRHRAPSEPVTESKPTTLRPTSRTGSRAWHFPMTVARTIVPRERLVRMARIMERILIIEDDAAVQESLRLLFERDSHVVEIASDGKSGLAAFRAFAPDLTILDLRLPDICGQDVCRQIKEKMPAQPVIVLSARCEEADKLVLLELGADDYVTKPFSPRELLARAHSVIRRTHRHNAVERYTFGEVCIDFIRMEATRAGRPIHLKPSEFRLVKYFCENPERVISRSELLSRVWHFNPGMSTRTVDNHVFSLRHELEHDPSKPVHFLGVRHVGYKFVP